MTKRHIYRVGDQIRIVEPKFVSRIGYPQTAEDLFWKSYAENPNLYDAAVLLEIIKPGQVLSQRVSRDLAYGAARAANRQQGFGGRERSLHYYEGSYYAEHKDQTNQIVAKQVAKTGNYYPPSGWGSGEDYDYEPGGLDNVKTHVILSLANGLRIEACNVTPVV